MQQKSVLILSAVTVAALAVAAMTLRDEGPAAPASGSTRLFPTLSERINQLAEVRVEKGGKQATLKKEGGQWKLADRGGYPANVEKVKELAMQVADLEIAEKKTAKKENHKKLAVEWPVTAEEGSEDGSAEAGAGLVTFRDAGGQELASVVLGKSEWMGSKPKVYARRAGEDQVYLCTPRGSLNVQPDAKTWIEAKFVELQNDRVQDVTIEHADGERVEVGRSAENHTQFTLKNLEPGKTERYAGVANGVAQALGYGLQLEDVRPVTEVDFTQSPLAKTRFRCVDGLELLIETAKFEDKNWVKVSASYMPPPEPEKPAEPTPPSDGAKADEGAKSEEGAKTAETADATKPEEAKPEEKKDVGKEAADLNQRLAPWAFEVASYKTDVLCRRMKDLLAETKPPEGEAQEDSLEDAMGNMGLEMEDEPAKEGGGSVEPAPTPADEGDVPAEEKEKKPE